MTEETEKKEKSERYRFGDFELDASQRELRRAGERVTVQPKAFDFLLYLVRHRSRAVDKDELQDALWPRSIVTETALTRVVMKARRAVGDDADRQQVIRTVHGHGYRFVAELADTAAAADSSVHTAPAAAMEPAAEVNRSLWRALAAAAAIIALVSLAWWYLATPSLSGPVRLAVLPVENATGDADLDWIETGFMALMNRMLQDRGVEVVSSRNVMALAADTSMPRLIAANSEFQQALHKTTAFTHMLAAKLEHENGLYRLTYTFLHRDDRPLERTDVDQQPTELIARAINTVSAIVEGGAPTLGNTRVVSGDPFLNEAYARGMSLEYAGRYEEAKQFFRIVIEQEPELFWPRYEYALCERNLRNFDAAEQSLQQLLGELDDDGVSYERLSANNALGVLYNSRRQHDDARRVLQEAIRIGTLIDKPAGTATAHINLALTERNLGNMQQALAELTTATDLYRQIDIASLPGSLLNNLSGVQITLGHLDKALENSLAAVDSFRLTGEHLYESYALSRLSNVQMRLGLLDDAYANTMNSLAIREELGDRRGVGISLIYLSRIELARGDLTRARQHGLQVRDIGEEIDDPDLVMGGLHRIAYADLRAGNAAAALENFLAAEVIAHELDDRLNEMESRAGAAQAYVALGEAATALQVTDGLMRAAEDIDADNERANAHNLYAEIHISQQDWNKALEHLGIAHALATQLANVETLATANEHYGRVYLESGRPDEARRYLDAAADARPNRAEIILMHARLAAADGDYAEALRIASDARTRAGEAWTADDEARLEDYRNAAKTADKDTG